MGNAVTIKRPLSPGVVVTSTEPILIPSAGPDRENSFHRGSKALQAGHHGA